MNVILLILAAIIIVVLLRAFVFVTLSLGGLLGVILALVILVLIIDHLTGRRI